MAKNNNSTPAPRKRRWYQNLFDSFTIVKRSFPWVTWAILGTTLLAVGGSIAIAIVSGHYISWSISAVLMLFFVPVVWLSALLRKAMYRQIEHMHGCVGAVIRDLRKGWMAEMEPVAVNRDQDVVWRLVGRGGVVLISEGKPNRAKSLLEDERVKTARVVPSVPITLMQCGLEEGQLRLEKIMKELYKLPKVISKAEVPTVNSRLKSLSAKGLPIPKGIDPYRARPDRRGLRG